MKSKKLLLLLAVAALALFMLAGLVLGGGNVSNTTAQSVMFATKMDSDFIITGSETWVYDKWGETGAASYFTNAWDGNPPNIVRTKGSCSQPSTPTTPPPIQNKLEPVLGYNKCAFWDGGDLTVNPPQVTYTQTETVKSGSGSTQCWWDFTWTYKITANQTSVEPRTAWTLQSSELSPAMVTLSGYLAGQSTVRKSSDSKNPWTFKASHTMSYIDPLTGQAVARLQNPTATLYDSGGNIVWGPQALAYSLETGVDYFYNQNAGTNGPIGQLVNGYNVNNIQNGLVPSDDGLSWDNFAGNNTTLGERVNLQQVKFAITNPGVYTLSITGTLKDVAGLASFPFSVDKQITVSGAEECTTTP
jgi:hypothetical protein